MRSMLCGLFTSRDLGASQLDDVIDDVQLRATSTIYFRYSAAVYSFYKINSVQPSCFSLVREGKK